ncbi:hypothetical protein ACHAWU_009887 [Discostella pseudostelligera]|uniref:Kinesin light chain n=1 Tax=Discostella pseudostelligera TaxID=259834 RepID=A0ABD3LYE0_9STRA
MSPPRMGDMSQCETTNDVMWSSAAPKKSKLSPSILKRIGRKGFAQHAADRADGSSSRGGEERLRDQPTDGTLLEEKDITNFNDKGNEFFGRGEYDAALRMYSEALKLLKTKNSTIVMDTSHGEVAMPTDMRRVRTARCLVNVGVVHIRQERFDDAIHALELAMNLSKMVNSDGNQYHRALEVMADANENIGLVHFKLKNYEQSSLMYNEALIARRQGLEFMETKHRKWRHKSKDEVQKDSDERNASMLELAKTLYYLAILRERQGNVEEALDLCEEALRLRKEAIPNAKQDPNSINLFTTIGRLYCHETVRRYSDALGYFQEVHRVKCEVAGKDHLDVVPSLNSLAFIYKELGEHKKCVVISDRAIGIATNGRGLNKEACVAFANKGDALKLLHDYDNAISSYETALRLQAKCLERKDVLNAEVREKLAEAYILSTDFDSAIDSLERSISVKRLSLSPDDVELARSYSKLGDYYVKNQEHSMGIKCHTRALRIFKHHDNKAMAATEHNKIAGILKLSGANDKAMEHYMAALWHSREASLPSTDPIVADTIKNLASFQKS